MIVQHYTNESQSAPLARYNNIVNAPRSAAETSRKTGALTRLTGNYKSESLIRNAPKLQITPPTTSPRPGRKRGESFIRNVSQKYKPGTNAEPLKQKKKIERTQPIRINAQRHQHHSIKTKRDCLPRPLPFPLSV